MRRNYDKEELIFYYQNEDFPTEMISKDVLVHKDWIFNESSEEPLVGQGKKIKLAPCFILEEEIEPKSKQGFKKGVQGSKQAGIKNPIQKPKEVWRKNEPEENTGFFDDFKGKTDDKQVEKFKRNLEVSFAKENSISIEQSVFNDHLGKVGELKQSKPHVYKVVDLINSSTSTGHSISVDSFFENADLIMGSSQNEVKKSKTNKLTQLMSYDPNPKIVSIDLIFKINEHLQYPREEKLWYIYHTVAKSSFGPLSSPNIKELYESKMLDGMSEVRFIDIYNLKNKKPFEFFHLKEIEHDQFLDCIEISALLKIAVNIKSKLTQELSNKNKKENTINKNLQSKPSKENPLTINTTTSLDSDSIYNIPLPAKPVVDENIVIIKKVEDSPKSSMSDKKSKKTPIPKGKPVELEVKLGFKLDEENEEKNKKPNPIKKENLYLAANQNQFFPKSYQQQQQPNNNQVDNFFDNNSFYEQQYDDGYNYDYNNNYYYGNNNQHYNNKNNYYWK